MFHAGTFILHYIRKELIKKNCICRQSIKQGNKVPWKIRNRSDTIEETEDEELQSFAISDTEVHVSFRSLVLTAVLSNSPANGYLKRQQQCLKP